MEVDTGVGPSLCGSGRPLGGARNFNKDAP
jgi:hypothetical protein